MIKPVKKYYALHSRDRPYLEVFKDKPSDYSTIKAAIFDFDGTISTLRQGWQDIMEPMMIEMITGNKPPDPQLIQEVKAYIDESTGIQTIFQMQWLVNSVKKHNINHEIHDEWWYKDEYNRRLLATVNMRVQLLTNSSLDPQDFMIKGAKEFLTALKKKGIELYVASGTDHDDVVREVEALGLSTYFEKIAGAPMRQIGCSKEAVLRELIKDRGVEASELLVVGDGKVEISLGAEMGAITLGTATDEISRSGVNPAKRKKLIDAGASAVVGDFSDYMKILNWLNI